MPRKPKPPPRDLVIQSLSTGKIVQEQYIECEFTNELVAVPEMYGPWKPPADLLAKQAEQRLSMQAQQRRLLDALGITAAKPMREHKPFKRRI